MSAIGSYELLHRRQFEDCLVRARQVCTRTTGKWIFRKTRTVGVREFEDAWRAAVVRSVDFDYSGYVLGHYVDAQIAINHVSLGADDADSQALSRVFTGVFIFRTGMSFPDLPQDQLQVFCRTEYGEDAGMAAEAIRAAHAFYTRGLAEITPDTVVAFVIR